MIEKRRKSALPIYCVGLVFVVFGLVFPLYKLSNFFLAVVCSALVYVLVGKKAPDEVTYVEAPVDTGDGLVDMAITEGRAQLKRIDSISKTVEDKAISAHIEELELIGEKILSYVEQNPKDAPVIRQFIDYYLPTTIKIIEKYAMLKAQHVKGENIEKAVEKIEGVLVAMVDAFKKIFDNLFEDDALDIVTDINVMQRLLKGEGLLDNDIDVLKKERDEK